MKFGTWTYDSAKVNLKFYRNVQKFDLDFYIKSNEWKIITNSASRNAEKYGIKLKSMKTNKSSVILIRLLSRSIC
jgi:hypothetical protein